MPGRPMRKNQAQRGKMRRFLIGLLSVGLLTAFSLPAFAVGEADVKVSGQYGLYASNLSLKAATSWNAGSYAVYDQSPRMKMDFKVSSGWMKQLSTGTNVFEPCLIFGSYWYNHAAGRQKGVVIPTTSSATSASDIGSDNYSYFFDNILFLQGYASVKPTPKLDISLSYSWLRANQRSSAINGFLVSAGNPEVVSNSVGTEFDFKAKYKIFDNLTYMIGAAYLWTGDYFKGTSESNQANDNYLLMHSLNLTF
jgi:hypothetical protein